MQSPLVSPRMTAKIKGFDGIRGLAVIAVVLSHLSVYEYLKSHGLLVDSLIAMIDGATGVQAFFILSGFLITMLMITEHNTYGRVSLRNFYIRRSLRIVPLYVLFLGLVTIATVIGTNVSNWQSLGFAYFYAYNFIPREWYSGILGHTWSLAVEEHFYLLWPVIFVMWFAHSPARRSRGLVLGVLTFYALSWIAHNVLSHIPAVNDNFFVSRWTFIAGSTIALGCALALVTFSGSRAPLWQRVLGSRACLAAGLILYCNSLVGAALRRFLNVEIDYLMIGDYLQTVGIGLMIVWCCLNQRSIIVRALEFAPLRYMGVISYGVYMYQGFFLSTSAYRVAGQNWPPDPLTGLLLLILVAPLSFHFFEKPFLRLKGKYETSATRVVDEQRPDPRRYYTLAHTVDVIGPGVDVPV